MPDPLKLPKGRDRRKLLIYGGVAIALLVVIVIRRRSAAAADPADAPLTAVPSPAADGGFGGVSGGDNGAQLAAFENGLFDQLPQAIQSGIEAGFANFQPAPAPASDPTTPNPQPDWAGLVNAAAGLINVGVGLGGAGAGPAQAAGPAQTVKPIPHPTVQENAQAYNAAQVAAEAAAVKNAPKEYTVTRETRHGVKGQVHHYPDGHNIWVPGN